MAENARLSITHTRFCSCKALQSMFLVKVAREEEQVLTLDRRASWEISLSVNTVGGDLNRAFLSAWAVLLDCIFEEYQRINKQVFEPSCSSVTSLKLPNSTTRVFWWAPVILCQISSTPDTSHWSDHSGQTTCLVTEEEKTPLTLSLNYSTLVLSTS